MIVSRFPKRHFPNAPNWVIGGLILITILWLAVLPIEIVQASANQDFLRPTLLGWAARSLYILGYGTALSLVSPWTTSDLRIIVVPLGLLIATPVYFALGALIATQKTSIKGLGVLLLVMKIIFGCVATVAIMFSAA